MEEIERIERSARLLTELLSMRGFVPREMQYQFENAMYTRLPVAFFAPAFRNKCTHVMTSGVRCNRTAYFYEETLCGVHANAREARERREAMPPKPKCTQHTARGEVCKYTRMPGSTACKRHATRDGLLPQIPTECSICYDDMTEETRHQTKCFHFFHKSCMERWINSRRDSRERVSCPMCRTSVRV
jgi:hypothetical protein